MRPLVSCWRPRAASPLLLVLVLAAAACCGRQKGAGPAATTPALVAAPHVTLVAVTDWRSVLKPCGCTVDLQKGGIERIAKAVDDLRAADDSVLVVHAGPLLADEEALSSPARKAQYELRIQTFVAALHDLGVAAVALAGLDLELAGDTARTALQQAQFSLLSAGFSGGIDQVRASRIVRTRSGVQVGLLGVDPRSAPDDAARQQVVAREVQALRQQGAQVVVVLSNLGLRQSRRLARAVPGIDAIVVGQLEAKIEPLEDLEREGDTILVHAATKGAYFAALTLVPRGRTSGPWLDASEFLPGAAAELQVRIEAMAKNLADWRQHKTVATERALPYLEKQLAEMRKRLTAAQQAAGKPLPPGRLAGWRSVGLSWSAPTDREIAQLVQAYDDRVAALNAQASAEVPPPKPGEAGYVGQAVCVACHVQTRDFAAKDLHGVAWRTLEKAEKTRDLDCVPCHVTGFGQPGGSALGKLEPLTAVQCEACHGPGSLHVAAPAKGAQSRMINAPGEAVCTTCHTPEHAPRFAFDLYRKRLLVPGHGLPLPGAP